MRKIETLEKQLLELESWKAGARKTTVTDEQYERSIRYLKEVIQEESEKLQNAKIKQY